MCCPQQQSAVPTVQPCQPATLVLVSDLVCVCVCVCVCVGVCVWVCVSVCERERDLFNEVKNGCVQVTMH